MSIVNKGFRGRRVESAPALPPGQHLTADFPVLQAGPTPRINLDDWRFTIRDELGGEHSWTWAQFKLLPSERLNVDIHCVTTWSKLNTKWEGVSLDTFSNRPIPLPNSHWSVRTAATPLIFRWTTFSAERPGSSTSTRAHRLARCTAARHGCWCRTSISGSPRSG